MNYYINDFVIQQKILIGLSRLKHINENNFANFINLYRQERSNLNKEINETLSKKRGEYFWDILIDELAKKGHNIDSIIIGHSSTKEKALIKFVNTKSLLELKAVNLYLFFTIDVSEIICKRCLEYKNKN